jgi:hypothetical protein
MTSDTTFPRQAWNDAHAAWAPDVEPQGIDPLLTTTLHELYQRHELRQRRDNTGDELTAEQRVEAVVAAAGQQLAEWTPDFLRAVDAAYVAAWSSSGWHELARDHMEDNHESLPEAWINLDAVARDIHRDDETYVQLTDGSLVVFDRLALSAAAAAVPARDEGTAGTAGETPSVTTDAAVDPYSFTGFTGPQNDQETISFANATAYEWAYLDTCREIGDALTRDGGDATTAHAARVPDGWSQAWLEHTRRCPGRRLAIREGFRAWRDTGTLPGLT